MRIEIPKNIERFGSVRFGDLQKVFELDSGMAKGPLPAPKHAIQRIPYQKLYSIYKDMAVVVPIKNERLKLIEGVLCGIPHPCLIIIVSASPVSSINRFNMEQDMLRNFCAFVDKNALIVHQKDPVIAKAFKNNDYTSILDETGMIRNGKAEGMLIGILLALLSGKQYISFIDADNYFPGCVEEYIREYAAGFSICRSAYTMVRIAWHSKPKIIESKLFFRKWGRASSSTNALLNNLIGHYTGFETEIIKTGNAGEHAMTMKLALNLDYSAGYSIEPYHIINLLEKFGGVPGNPLPKNIKEQIEVYQIESRNPHLHEAGDKEHIDRMLFQAMQVIYHSTICPESLKKQILRDAITKKYVQKDEQIPQPPYFPALSCINFKTFLKDIVKTPYGQLINNGIGEESQ